MTKRVLFPSVYRLGQLSLDGFIAWFACSFAFWLRFDGVVPETYQSQAWILPLLAIPSRLLIQNGFGLYQRVWRLFCLKDVTSLFHAVTLYSLLVLVTTRLLIPRFQPLNSGIPLGVAVMDWSFCLLGMVALRHARRWSVYRTQLNRHCRSRQSGQISRVLLVGACMAGCQVVQETRQNPQLNLKVVGFIDDDSTKLGRKVEGVPVLGRTSELVAVAHQLNVDEVLISMPYATAAQIRKVVNLALGTPLKLKVLPGHAEILRDRNLTPQAREVQIQDILGRPEVRLDFAAEFSLQFPQRDRKSTSGLSLSPVLVAASAQKSVVNWRVWNPNSCCS